MKPSIVHLNRVLCAQPEPDDLPRWPPWSGPIAVSQPQEATHKAPQLSEGAHLSNLNAAPMRNLGNAAVAKAVLRGLLRFAKSSKDVPITLRTSDLYAVAPVLRGVNVSLQDRNAVEQITRQAFRLGAELEGHAAEAAVNRALDALRLLNTTYSTLIEEMRSTRADRADRSGVAFRIGDVFIHRKFGYRGVM